MFVTFNEPTVKSFFGYVVGNHPPGHMLQFRLAGTVRQWGLVASRRLRPRERDPCGPSRVVSCLPEPRPGVGDLFGVSFAITR